MKILVVDDEHDVQVLFEQRFRKEIKSGLMDFSFAYSGPEALDFLKDHQQEFVLILSDINMPGMSGLVLLERIKEKHSTPPPSVIMVTAYGDEYNHEEAMRLGADGFLEKPINFNSLKVQLLEGKTT